MSTGICAGNAFDRQETDDQKVQVLEHIEQQNGNN